MRSDRITTPLFGALYLMFYHWWLRKITYYLTILKAVLIGLIIASFWAAVLLLFAIYLYEAIFILLLIFTHFLPFQDFYIRLNPIFKMALIIALPTYIPLVLNALFWPIIISLVTIGFQAMLTNHFNHKPLPKDNDFDDLQMPIHEELELIRKQEKAFRTLKEYDLSDTQLQHEEKALLHTIHALNDRLAPDNPEGIEDVISADTFKTANKPFILLFKEYQVNNTDQWASYSVNGSNIYAFTKESMDGYYHPKNHSPATNHPINNQEKIFEPNKRVISENGIEKQQNTRYRFHTYQLLVDGKTPLCLELCTLAEKLVALLNARNALKRSVVALSQNGIYRPASSNREESGLMEPATKHPHKFRRCFVAGSSA